MPENVLSKIKKDNIKFIELQFIDINGKAKTVSIPVNMYKSTLEDGKWFDGSSIEGFSRIAEGDMYLKPDEDTYVVLPFHQEEYKTARIICDAYTPDGNPFQGDPRRVLKNMLEIAKAKGYKFMVCPELEFFLLSNVNGAFKPHDSAGYFDYPVKDQANLIKKEIMTLMQKVGIEPEMAHHEVSPGQQEIGFKYGDALKIADQTILFKQIVKTVAQKYGLMATFMPKPFKGINGSGMHTHFSLKDKDGKNVFFDSSDEYNLSATAKMFIEGVLTHVREINAVLNPTVNSYKRLVPGFEAPVYISYASNNRSALIRIPQLRKKGVKESSARGELRCPDSSCNPYLAFAAILAAGLDGLNKKMKIREPVEENIYKLDENQRLNRHIETLPESLGHAIHHFEQSELIKKTFGEHLFREYLRSRKLEWDNFRIQVTDWETKTYLEEI